jgi:hypothetical protein
MSKAVHVTESVIFQIRLRDQHPEPPDLQPDSGYQQQQRLRLNHLQGYVPSGVPRHHAPDLLKKGQTRVIPLFLPKFMSPTYIPGRFTDAVAKREVP